MRGLVTKRVGGAGKSGSCRMEKHVDVCERVRVRVRVRVRTFSASSAISLSPMSCIIKHVAYRVQEKLLDEKV